MKSFTFFASAFFAILLSANAQDAIAAPTVSITSPTTNANFGAPAKITIAASATPASGTTITKVDFYRGTTLLGTDTTSPYSYTWSNVAIGNYSLTAKATDSSGATKTSAAIAITVKTNVAPTVSLTSPANNASFTAPASIALAATATAAAGSTISKVDFYNGEAKLGTDTSAPYTYTWSGVPVGNYSLTAKATDSAGISTTSTAVSIVVKAPVSKPSVAITSPVSGATFAGPATISIAATAAATATGATISKVDFYNGAMLLGSALAAPYTYTWSNVPAGGYLLTAKATDSLGSVTTSALVYAIVDGADTCTTTPPLTANSPDTKLAAQKAFGKLPLTFEANMGQAHPEVRFQARGQGYQFFLAAHEQVLALQGTGQTKTAAAVRMRFIGANLQPRMSGVDPVEQKSHYLIGNDPSAWRAKVPHFAKVRYEALYPGVDEIFYGTQGKLEYDLHVAPGANPRAIRFALDGIDSLSLDQNGDLLLKVGRGTLLQKKPLAYQEIDGRRHKVSVAYQLLAANKIAFRIGKYDKQHPLVIDPVLVYSTYLGGANNGSGANAISISRCGEAFIAGWTYATDFPTTTGAFDPTAVPATQMGFVSKLNQSGTGLLYSSYVTGTIQNLGGGVTNPQSSTVASIAVDAGGHAFIGGTTSATDFPVTPGSLNPAAPAPGANAGFAAKLNTDGSAFMYSTYLGKTIAGVAVDGAGSAYLAGGQSAFKLNPAGATLAYTFPVGVAASADYATAIAVDSSGNAYVTGVTVSNGLAVTTGAFQTIKPSLVGNASGFISKINPTGTALVYGAYLGTAGNFYPRSLALDAMGNAYVTGMADDNTTIPNYSGVITSFNQNVSLTGNSHAFVAKLNAGGSSLGFFSRIGGANCNASTCSAASTQSNAVALDQSGNVWLTGITASNQIPLVKPLYSQFSSVSAGPDIFTAKLSPGGTSLIFSTLLGGQTLAPPPLNGLNTPTGSGIAIDLIGSAYIAGATNKSDFPTTAGSFQTTLGASAGVSAFVIKINESKDTTTTLAVTPASGSLGDSISLTANISGNLPSGTVTFLDGTATLGTASVSGTSAVFTTSLLAVGAHVLSANYGGDVHNNPSSSTTVVLNIANLLPPTVSLTTPVNGASYAAPTDIVLTASAAPAVGASIAKVDFYDGAALLGTATAPPYSYTYTSAPVGSHTLTAQATDSKGANATSIAVMVTVAQTAVLNPPPVDRTVASVLANTTAFLYSGSNPIQTGVAPGTIEAKRAAVLRGKVQSRDNLPLSGVKISILNHPEFGQTLSRADGMFDMAVNGGGVLTLRYEKSGYLAAQRQINTPWQDFAYSPDVVMIALDAQVTAITTNASATQVARGSVSTDTDGARQATMLFAPATTATMTLPDGSTLPLTTLNVRATEYTVGANGPNAMPATLPPTSGYTYAVELSVDEAIAAGAKDVSFSQPVPVYVENFLNFPVGGIVPAGYYDRDKAAWIPAPNGRVIKILAVVGGLAELDTDGDGLADDAAKLAALNISDAERTQLATLYAVGQTLWRVPVSHFTPWDCNWPYGPPPDAAPPQQPEPKGADDEDKCDICDGSIIETQNQTLGERVNVTGAPFSLHYKSDRVPGRKAANTISISLSGASVPASLRRIELVIYVAGRQFIQTFSAAPNQRTTFVWDGKDAYGRVLQGSQPVYINVGYVYGALYQQPAQFAQSFGAISGNAISASRARQEVILWQTSLATLEQWGDARTLGLGGWSASIQHAYDPNGKILVMGDGTRHSAQTINRVITTVVGNGTTGFSGDGGAAKEASLFTPRSVTIDPKGNLFIADYGNHRIRKVNPAGIITTVAGNGGYGFSGDGGEYFLKVK